MMTNDRAMLDANLVVYAFYPKAPQYQPARQTLDQAQAETAGLCVTSQVLAEFYAVVTNARAARGHRVFYRYRAHQYVYWSTRPPSRESHLCCVALRRAS